MLKPYHILFIKIICVFCCFQTFKDLLGFSYLQPPFLSGCKSNKPYHYNQKFLKLFLITSGITISTFLPRTIRLFLVAGCKSKGGIVLNQIFVEKKRKTLVLNELTIHFSIMLVELDLQNAWEFPPVQGLGYYHWPIRIGQYFLLMLSLTSLRAWA